MKNSIKLAAAVCGLVGSISFNPNAEMEYLEDDSLFAKTTAQLVYGWEWGVSKANAIEVIEVRGYPFYWPGPGYGGGGGGGGGGDASQPDSPGDEFDPERDRERKHRRCMADANGDRDFCRDFSSNVGTLSAIGCAAVFKLPSFIAWCGSLAVGLTNYGNGICDDVHGVATADCDDKFG